MAREGPLPLEEAVAIGRQMLLGLAAAHHAGIVHRDLKPANVQLVPGGGVKIMDFGLAKVRELGLTAPELRPGTAAYMSPEQLRAEPLDGRADLWSFGVVMHEMLTGRPPFGGGHDLATLYSILYEQPLPPSATRPDVPAALDALVTRLLSKESSARFATAEETLAELDAAVGANVARLPGRAGRRTRRRVLLTLVAICAAGGAVAALGTGFGWPAPFEWRSGQPPAEPGGTASPANPLASIAVLPFVDLSPAGDQEYFADGITEELLTALAHVPGLRVPARTSSFYFKGKDLPVGEVARHLGVATVLEGSVRRAGDSVRITVQLVDARADRRLWTRTFDRDVRDIFAIQTEIARAATEALQVRLAAGQGRGGPAPTASLAAHDLYLRGLFHWNRRTATDLAHAIRFFEEATRIDPAYARAYAGLALTHAVLRVTAAETSPEQVVDAVEAAAGRALALDASLAEAHAARAYTYHWTWRWDDAEREFRRAIALSPGYATAHQWYGEHLVKMGRSEEGLAELRQALALDPLSLVANNDLGL
ncbi:MAG TPA: protein kinase, partial [Myxococcota bacterium]|nr:protein kinase [Myxococcota bacterium]